jgi:hypothetical protein
LQLLNPRRIKVVESEYNGRVSLKVELEDVLLMRILQLRYNKNLFSRLSQHELDFLAPEL